MLEAGALAAAVGQQGATAALVVAGHPIESYNRSFQPPPPRAAILLLPTPAQPAPQAAMHAIHVALRQH